MKHTWQIPFLSEKANRIALTYGDPADALEPAKNYALKSLPEAITNWSSIASLLREDHVYDVTAFYSKRKTNLTKEAEQQLQDVNQRAFDAAKKKGGLLLYFQGVIVSNPTEKTNANLNLSFSPNCMSFCIWNSLAEAKAGAKIDAHKEASRQLRLWYDAFAIEKYQLTRNKTSLHFQRVPYQ